MIIPRSMKEFSEAIGADKVEILMARWGGEVIYIPKKADPGAVRDFMRTADSVNAEELGKMTGMSSRTIRTRLNEKG